MSLASRPVYTSNQITVGAALGGAIASTMMMRNNFLVFGDIKKAKLSLVYGLTGFCVILALSLILPKWVPNATIPAVCASLFRMIAKRSEMDKYDLLARDLPLRSNWKVLLISLLYFLASFAVVFVLAIIYEASKSYILDH